MNSEMMNNKMKNGACMFRALNAMYALACAAYGPAVLAAEPPDSGVPAVEDVGAPRALPEGTPSLQMSTDFAYPALGFGTYMPMGQVESRGVRVTPFTVRAAIQAGIGYDDNVVLSNANKTGSFFTTVAPSVAAGLEGATQRYYATYRGNYGVYTSNAQADYADHNLALNAANYWTTRLRTLLSYDYIRAHSPRGITSTTQTERWTSQAMRGRVSYGAEGAQGRLDGDVAYSTRRVGDGAASRTGNYDRFEVGGAFSYRVAPKTRALVRVGWADIEHSRDPTLDNTENSVAVGVTWEALATTTGRVTVGYTTKDFSGPAREDFDGPSFEAGVLWRPVERTSVDLSARRFTAESYELGSNLVVNTAASAVWSHTWPRQIRSTVNYAYGRIRHEGIARTETYQALGGRVSYPVRRSVRLGAELRHDVRDSDFTGADYTRNIILLTVESAL